MVKAQLVAKEIEAGQRIFEHLSQHDELRIEAAFWWQEDEEWRFVVATPIVHEEGRLAAHKKIRRAIEGNKVSGEYLSILDRLDVLTPSEGLITVLDTGLLGEVPLGRLIVGESIRGVYVEGAYFYHFAPKTFIRS